MIYQSGVLLVKLWNQKHHKKNILYIPTYILIFPEISIKFTSLLISCSLLFSSPPSIHTPFFSSFPPLLPSLFSLHSPNYLICFLPFSPSPFLSPSFNLKQS